MRGRAPRAGGAHHPGGVPVGHDGRWDVGEHQRAGAHDGVGPDRDPTAGRGPGPEARVIVDAHVGDLVVARVLVRAIARGTDADYVIRIPDRVTRRGFVRLPRTGPVLACRALDGAKSSAPPTLGEWALTMGDVELL